MGRPIDDIDGALAAAAATFSGRAAGCRERAELADEGVGRGRDPIYEGRLLVRSRRLYEAGRVWDCRAREARRGSLLLRAEETGDAEFMREFTDLIIACEAAGRCRYVRRLPG